MVRSIASGGFELILRSEKDEIEVNYNNAPLGSSNNNSIRR